MELTDLGVVPAATGLREERDALATLERADPADRADAKGAGYAERAHAEGAVSAANARGGHQGRERLLVWESDQTAVVLPRNGLAEAWANLDACAARNVPVLRRDSGGGAVVLGPGCLCVALILSLDARPALADVTASYAVLLGAIAESLSIPHVSVQCTDLAVGNRKFAGHAQRRLRRTLLHHGAILYGFDLDLIDALLPEPPRRPAWRGSRRHREFLTNVPLDRTELVARLRQLPAAIGG